jgi:PAS domain S-box-containing protein
MQDRIRELEAELARVRAERDTLQADLQRASRYVTAVEKAPTAVMCVSGEQGRYVFVNQAFADLVGRSLDEVLASDPYQIWVEVTHADEIEEERGALERIAKGEIDGYRLEKRIVPHGGGEPRWVRADLRSSREANGRLECITAYFTDIHEQRTAIVERDRFEEQLRQTQKMDALGKLAGGVAHDFNNRLLIIIGYTELLKRELPVDGHLVQHADEVLASAQRGAELTRQLLAYSRRQVLQPEAFNINETVGRMRCLLERLIGDRIHLVTALDAESAVYSDPGQIEQVILNLAINARDAMPQGGRLTLETDDVKLGPGEHDSLPPGDYVSLSVSDTGVGIPADVVPHIFEPFFTTKDVGQGTGLGLSMVQGIVHQSGGAVRVASRAGEGACFTVHLPRATGIPAPRYASVAAAPRDIDFETVLVCDDDEGVRRLLAEVLGLRAYRILQASNGKQALEVARHHRGPIHLLVTDLVMPEIGGMELAAELRRRDPALRVLYVSGYTEDAATLSEPLAPNTRFLAKPFLPGDLTSAVFSMLEQRAGTRA